MTKNKGDADIWGEIIELGGLVERVKVKGVLLTERG